jgi:hypothetical protein
MLGINVIDTMLAIKASVPEHSLLRSMTTKTFSGELANEMVMNTLDGCVCRPKKRKVTTRGEVQEVTPHHVLIPLGKVSDYNVLKEGQKDFLKQLKCKYCQKNTTSQCALCKIAICQVQARACYQQHLSQFGIEVSSELSSPVVSPGTPLTSSSSNRDSRGTVYV